MKESLISVVIIAYNTEKYLEKCINSVLNQTYKNIEILIVNDGSTDKSADIANRKKEEDSRIKFIDRKENKGTMYTRIEGYKNSKGNYVIFIDSDDFLVNNAIEILYNKLISNNADIVRGEMKRYDGKNYIESKKTINNEIKITKEQYEPLLYDLLCETIYCNSMVGQLVKKENLKDIEKVDITSTYGEDLRSNLYLYENVNTILYIPDELYVYRINENSITNTVRIDKLEVKLKEAIDTYLFLFNYINSKELKNKNKYIQLSIQKLYYYIMLISIDILNTTNYKTQKLYLEKLEKRILKVEKIKWGKIKVTNRILYKIPMFLLRYKLYYLLNIYIKIVYNPMMNIFYKIRRKR